MMSPTWTSIKVAVSLNKAADLSKEHSALSTPFFTISCFSGFRAVVVGTCSHCRLVPAWLSNFHLTSHNPITIYFIVLAMFFRPFIFLLFLFLFRKVPLTFIVKLLWIYLTFTYLQSFWFLLWIRMIFFLGRIILVVGFFLSSL